MENPTWNLTQHLFWLIYSVFGSILLNENTHILMHQTEKQIFCLIGMKVS